MYCRPARTRICKLKTCVATNADIKRFFLCESFLFVQNLSLHSLLSLENADLGAILSEQEDDRRQKDKIKNVETLMINLNNLYTYIFCY